MGYKIFLSYSHKDEEFYSGAVAEIKRHIERFFGEDNIVFLDSCALRWGDTWNTRIRECLGQCNAFICLLSENYLKSDYCALERLWWSQRELEYGLLYESFFPIYYKDIKDFLRKNSENKIYIGNKIIRLKQFLQSAPWLPCGKDQTPENLVKFHLQDEQLKQIKKIVDNFGRSEKSPARLNGYNPHHFVGRILELAKIWDICQEPGSNAQSIPIIFGEAGCGKTELALAYAYGYSYQYPGGRFLINAEGLKSWDEVWKKFIHLKYDNSYVIGIKLLKFNENELSQVEASEISKRFWQYLNCDDQKKEDEEKKISRKDNFYKGKHRTLFLLDNLDCLNLISDEGLGTVFESGKIHCDLDIVVTTREAPYRYLQENSRAIGVEIGPLRECDGVEILRRSSSFSTLSKYRPFEDDETLENFRKKIRNDGKSQESSQKELENAYEEYQQARELVKALDYHAWSIGIIGAYWRKGHIYGVTLEKILKTVQKDLKLLNTSNSRYTIGCKSYSQLLQPTIELIIQKDMGSEIIVLAYLCSLFAADFIPLQLIQPCWEDLCNTKKTEEYDTYLYAWKTLAEFNLLRVSEEEITEVTTPSMVRMHRITISYFQQKFQEMPTQEQKRYKKTIERHILKSCQLDEEAEAVYHMALKWLSCSWGFEHLLFIIACGEYLCRSNFLSECMRIIDGVRSMTEENVEYLNIHIETYLLEGNCYEHFYDYLKAKQAYESALLIVEKNTPENQVLLAKIYNNLGCAYRGLGEYFEAEKFLESAKEKCLKNIDDISAKCLYGIVIDNLYGILFAKQQYEKIIDNIDFMEPHHAIVASTNNALYYFYSRNLTKAQYCSEENLKILHKKYPLNHKLIACNNDILGNVYLNLGKYKEARYFYIKALLEKRKMHVRDMLELAKSYNNLGCVYVTHKKYMKALRYFIKALNIRKSMSSSIENDLAITTLYDNMGIVYRECHSDEEAIACWKLGLMIKKKQKMRSSVDTIITIADLFKDGEKARALKFVWKELQDLRKFLPQNDQYFIKLSNFYIALYNEVENI